MTKVLVTGANGLLGSHVVRELIKRNFSVRILVRKGSNLKAIENLKIETITGEITNKKDIYKAVESCNYVIHIAARTAQLPSRLGAFRQVNIESTTSLIEACKEFKTERFIYVSTANCFGNGSIEKPGTEKSPFLPWLKKSGYAFSKYLAQQEVLNAAQKGLDAVIVNPTFILGENDHKPSSGQIFAHILNKRFAFFPPGGKNFVDAGMAASGIVNALKKGKSGNCYLLAGENHSYKDFFKMVIKITGQQTILLPIPKFILLAAGRIGSMLDVLLKRSIHLTYTNAKMLCLGNYFTPEKAIQELDLEVLPTSDSASKAISWFKKNNYFEK